MYKFESRYKNLSFYNGNKLKKFSNGIYTTEDKEEAEMLIKSNSFKLVEKPKKNNK